MPLVRIRPPRRWEGLNLSSIWRFRELMLALAVRDIKLRYRQTALGVLWVLLQPLVGAGIFAFVFGRVARLDTGGPPYVLFSYAGLLAWNLFNGSVLKIAGSLVGNSALVSKVFFPRLVLPLSGALSSLLDFAVGLAGGVALLIAYHRYPTLSILAVPIWLGLIVMFAIGLGLVCAALAVSYRDVIHVLPVAMQMLLYGSPVGYSVAVIPGGWPRFLYKLNPLAALFEGFRTSLLGQGSVGVISSAWAISCTILLFFTGLFFFRRMEREFADVI